MIEKKDELNIGVLYLSLHNLLKRKYGYRPITKKQLFCELGKHFLVPKSMKIVVINEMESRGLLKKENKNELTLLNCDFDIIENKNRFYEKIGIF